MLAPLLLVALALALLTLGGDWLVKGAVGLARRFHVSPLLIGVTVIAWGTSAPELLVSVDAAFRGSPGIAVGNVVGSNVANIWLILGAAALVHPITVSPRALSRDGVFALAAALLFVAAALLFGEIGRGYALFMLAALAAMALYTYRDERRRAATEGDGGEGDGTAAPAPRLPASVAFTGAGIGLLMFGADLLVENAILLAKGWGVSDTVIGLTVVAVGTSLPELFASVMAALRGQPDVALGNVTGSNIYNIMAILGVAGLIAPIPIPAPVVRVDMWIMLGATLLVPPALLCGNRIGRRYGGLFLILYAAYTAWLFLRPAA